MRFNIVIAKWLWIAIFGDKLGAPAVAIIFEIQSLLLYTIRYQDLIYFCPAKNTLPWARRKTKLLKWLDANFR